MDLRDKEKVGAYKNTKQYPSYDLRKSNPDVYLVLKEDWDREEARIGSEFRLDCRREFEGAIGFALRDTAWSAVFSKAWEDGHSSGHHEVITHLLDMVDFVKFIIDGSKIKER